MTDSDWKLPWEGGCRCGDLRFRSEAPPLITMACHCRGCQRMTGSAYSLSVAVPAEGFTILQGGPIAGGMQGSLAHMHCARCLSWVFTRPQGLDWLVNLRATMLDDPAWSVPFIETCTDEKLPWATVPATHSFAGFPEHEMFPALMEEFSRVSPRPR